MRKTVFSSLNQIQAWACHEVLRHGEIVSPRDSETREIRNVGIELTDPRARVVTLPSRKWSLPIAVGELCWNLRGATDTASLAYYAPRWHEIVGGASTIRGSCYGKRIFGSSDGSSQWDRLVRLLKTDPHSRRALLLFGDASSYGDATSLDEPCVTSMQFLCRDGRLEAYVQMRSNDAIWGLPYDVFLFSTLQELLANELGLEVGGYFHHAVSLHIYKRHFRVAERIASERTDDKFSLPPLGSHDDLNRLLDCEERLRSGGGISQMDLPVSKTYCGFAACLKEFAASKTALIDASFLLPWIVDEQPPAPRTQIRRRP
jgi:thymidylate synthase